MQKMQKILLLCLLPLIVLVCSCADDKTKSTLPPTHPDSWMDVESIDFHGNVISAYNDATGCKECHGDDFKGGKTEISCTDCHLGSGACISCHGGIDNQTGAPPKSLSGETEATNRTVGAHTAHLEATNSRPLVCDDCHLVPGFLLDSTHLDLNDTLRDNIAEVMFNPLTETDSTTWDHDAATCANSYCHGKFTHGNNAVPVWHDSTTGACGSCHDDGSSPANLGGIHTFHLENLDIGCAYCHAGVMNADDSFNDPLLHVNGFVDTLTLDTAYCNECHAGSGGGCTLCHGGTDNTTGAPPVGLDGETAVTDLAVGAHTAHLENPIFAAVLDCDACHVTPGTVTSAGHLDGDSIPEINFDSLAGSLANWNRAAATCENIYCHGEFSAGSHVDIVWNSGISIGCGDCHDDGTNPASLGWKHQFHVGTAGIRCEKCHAQVVDNLDNIIDFDLHVNGLLDTLVNDTALCNTCHGAGSGCIGCHGGTDNISGAPPVGLEGETATTDLAVGVHTVHLEGKIYSDGVLCEDCHTVPVTLLAIGHLGDDNIAEINFSTLAGGTASWDRVAGRCDNSYCHGNFSAGTITNPTWHTGETVACGDCHDVGSNPASLGWSHDFHVGTASIGCDQCHAAVVDDLSNIIGKDLHINGFVDTLTADTSFCNSCHGPGQGCTACHGGSDNTTGAPPEGLEGETHVSDLAVGAHSAHVETGLYAEAMDCDVCHVKPVTLSDAGHLDGDDIAEITFGTIAGGTSSWDRGLATCQNTYCHGNFPAGSNDTPVWNSGSSAVCGDCHDDGSSPNSLGWAHAYHVTTAGIGCDQCHANVVDNFSNIIGKDLHVNGVIDTLIADTSLCNSCHGPGMGCTLCHGGVDNITGAPPIGLEDETSTTDLAVGAHTVHLEGGSFISDGILCEDCHTVPEKMLSAGHLGSDDIAELNFSALAGATTVWNRAAERCENNYCHGNFSGGYPANQPLWTSQQPAHCGSCHDIGYTPEDLSGEHKKHVVDESISCATCHSTVVDGSLTIIGMDLHVNGSIEVNMTTGSNPQYINGDCTGIGCHGRESW